jgi:hypothetical protein
MSQQKKKPNNSKEEEEVEITEEELTSAFMEVVNELREKYGDEWIKHIMP